MEKLNSYYGVAENDFMYAKSGFDTGKLVGNFNMTAAICSQAAEKYLKAVIEKCFPTDDEIMTLLRTHNLRSLYNKIITKYKLSIDSKSCKWLGDFYFDARYPGDNFVIVNESDATECIRLVALIREDVTKILSEEEKKRCEERERLEKLRAFQ